MKNNTYIIAEIAQAHDGSLGMLHSYIDALAATGVDAVKFQTHIAEAESSEHEQFRINFSYVDKSRYDYWRRMEFSPEQWRAIKKHCDEAGVEFLSSPFSNAAVDILESLDVTKYKIGSGEVNNFLMLEKIARTGKDIILSSGMSSYAELDDTVAFLQPYGNALSVLQCTTSYPTQPEQLGLNVLKELKDRYKCPVGFSDHSGSVFPCLAAVTLGAEIVEFHACFDRRMFGPDSIASLEIDEIKHIVDGIRTIDKALNAEIDKSRNDTFAPLKKIFEKSLSVNKEMKAGDTVTFDDLESKKPAGFGIDPKKYKDIIGKTLKKDIKKQGFITWEDINE